MTASARFRWSLTMTMAVVMVLAGVVMGARGARGEGRDPLADDDGLPDALGDHSVTDDDDRLLQQQESRNVAPRAYSGAAYGGSSSQQLAPGGFRPSAALAELAGYARPAGPPTRPHGRPHTAASPAAAQSEQEEPEEADEPDRLAQLLQQSRFECSAKPGGYYADVELACEVFHYCQDGVKHSWICPDGFTFHQVHLICMPPTHDNICQQSAKYHFVNDYLYRAVNEEEKARRPDLPLKYADRYYPAEVYNDDRREYDDDREEEPRPQPQPQAQSRPQPQSRAQPRPQSRPQVFLSAEEVNIPLGQRRPQPPYDFDF